MDIAWEGKVSKASVLHGRDWPTAALAWDRAGGGLNVEARPADGGSDQPEPQARTPHHRLRRPAARNLGAGSSPGAEPDPGLGAGQDHRPQRGRLRDDRGQCPRRRTYHPGGPHLPRRRHRLRSRRHRPLAQGLLTAPRRLAPTPAFSMVRRLLFRGIVWPFSRTCWTNPRHRLESVRARIDAIDAELLRLVDERAGLAKVVAAAKRAAGDGEKIGVRPVREAQLLPPPAGDAQKSIERPGRQRGANGASLA